MTTSHLLHELSEDAALTMLSAVRAHAQQLGVAVCIAIVGPQGLPILRFRMQGAPLHSAEYADDKAYTAASFKRPTHQWDERLEAHPKVQQALAGHPRMLMLGGGVPVLMPITDPAETGITNDVLLGAIGVSGASVEQDIQCAEAAIAALRALAPNT
ncbi:GlcG/HbpS family heme-binding protein [Oceanobacter kriegii]|uniref:GlcG/HbpS family heme-binding protein n=1 Tax=Oceanobacter kriegii TaxID=64972 RepID=UPI00041E924B|nr:heme-binding protein [Oceanobacter kriegii]